jgi:hypothetical protein
MCLSLYERVAAMAHVKDLSLEKVGVDRIIKALAPNAWMPFAIPHKPDRILAVQKYLLTSGEKLSSADREALAGLPVFLDDAQVPSPLSRLVQTADERLRNLYAGTKLRAFLDAQSSSMKLARALGFVARITECTVETLIRDIAKGFVADGVSPLTEGDGKADAVLQFLSDKSGSIPAQAMEKLMGLPLFPDESGARGTVKSSQASAAKAGMYTVQPELRRVLAAIGFQLLAAEMQEALKPLLRHASISEVKLWTAIELLELKSAKAAPLQDLKILAELHALLISESRELKKHFPAQTRPGLADGNPRLCGLKVWPTKMGEVISADEAVDPGPLLQLLEAGRDEREEFAGARADVGGAQAAGGAGADVRVLPGLADGAGFCGALRTAWPAAGRAGAVYFHAGKPAPSRGADCQPEGHHAGGPGKTAGVRRGGSAAVWAARLGGRGNARAGGGPAGVREAGASGFQRLRGERPRRNFQADGDTGDSGVGAGWEIFG